LQLELEKLQCEAIELRQRPRSTAKVLSELHSPLTSELTRPSWDCGAVADSVCVQQATSVIRKRVASAIIREVPTRRHSCDTHAQLEILRGQRILCALEENTVRFSCQRCSGCIHR
jgi:hypothetical protein